MKRCLQCLSDMTGTHGKKKFCSSKCRDDHGNAKVALRRKLGTVLQHINCEVCGCPHLTKRAHARFCSVLCRSKNANSQHTSGFWTLRYSSKIKPEVERILRIASKATKRQKGILADFLLHRGGDVLNHHEVDYFIADYNTRHI